VSVVLCYHALSDAWDSPLAVTPARFERQIRHWLRRGYEPVTFSQAVGDPSRSFAVTFDDAFASVHSLALPILRALRVPATVFVPTAFPGAAPLSWPGIEHWAGSAELRCMDWAQIDGLRELGWEIGSHTVTHPHLTELGDAELARELRDSREALGGCTSLAYPYGDVDARVIAATAQAGYTAAAALPAKPHAATPLEWPRIGVYRKDGAARVALKELRGRGAPRGHALAVHTDQLYRRDAAGLSTAQPFALFVAQLREHCDDLVICGRLEEGRAAHALPPNVRFAPLPAYGSATDPVALVRGAGAALRTWWRVLDDADTAWLLGPSAIGVLFALLTLARGRRLTLGVRQDLPTYARTRHPGRRSVALAADVLDAAWRALARRAGATVVIGAALAQRYGDAPGLLDARISLMSERELEAPERDWAGTLRVLSVSRLDEEKNPLLLADVLALLPARFELAVCGEGPLAAALRERLDPARGTLLGALPREELLAEYRRSHLLLHVSRTEGVPQVLFEAFATGAAVVATDVGGVAAAADGAALLIPPSDAQAAADALERLAGDEALRSRLLSRAGEIARESTLERCAATVAQALLQRSSS
jgi:peptidoglycan/xylan/chitin deacetylase (PgdA/CDA1 family)